MIALSTCLLFFFLFLCSFSLFSFFHFFALALGVFHYVRNSYAARGVCKNERETPDIRIGRKNIVELVFFFFFFFSPSVSIPFLDNTCVCMCVCVCVYVCHFYYFYESHLYERPIIKSIHYFSYFCMCYYVIFIFLL